MFDQVDATFHNGLSKHINDSQQQFNSMHSTVAIALRVCVLLICIVVGCRSYIFMFFLCFICYSSNMHLNLWYIFLNSSLACCMNLVYENVK